LAWQGVDKHLADRARKTAAVPADKFEAGVSKAKALAVVAVKGDKEIIRAARADATEEKRARRVHEAGYGANSTSIARRGRVVSDPYATCTV
jgi:hypothetical protein